jgi:hypothetical protein
MRTKTPALPRDNDAIVFGLTTALTALRSQLRASKNEASEAKKKFSLLQAFMQRQARSVVELGIERGRAIEDAKAAEEQIAQLEGFLERVGLDVAMIKREGHWAWSAAPLLKVVYDESRAAPDTPDTILAAAQQLAFDRRKTTGA